MMQILERQDTKTRFDPKRGCWNDCHRALALYWKRNLAWRNRHAVPLALKMQRRVVVTLQRAFEWWHDVTKSPDFYSNVDAPKSTRSFLGKVKMEMRSVGWGRSQHRKKLSGSEVTCLGLRGIRVSPVRERYSTSWMPSRYSAIQTGQGEGSMERRM